MAPVPACFSGLGGRAVLLAFVRFRYTPKRLNLFAFVHFCSTPAPTRAGVFRRVRRPPRRSLLVAFGLPPRRPQKGYFGVFRCISGHSRPLPSSQFAGSRWRAVPRPPHWCPARSVLVGFGLPHHRPAGVFRRVSACFGVFTEASGQAPHAVFCGISPYPDRLVNFAAIALGRTPSQFHRPPDYKESSAHLPNESN